MSDYFSIAVLGVPQHDSRHGDVQGGKHCRRPVVSSSKAVLCGRIAAEEKIFLVGNALDDRPIRIKLWS
jgi:hypothetical protein